jgi:hypothetical protein
MWYLGPSCFQGISSLQSGGFLLQARLKDICLFLQGCIPGPVLPEIALQLRLESFCRLQNIIVTLVLTGHLLP